MKRVNAPPGATGIYLTGLTGTYQGFSRDTWIKDIDLHDPQYPDPQHPIARLWSHRLNKWKETRQMIDMKRVIPLEQDKAP